MSSPPEPPDQPQVGGSTNAAAAAAVNDVVEPILHRSIGELGLLEEVRVDGNRADVTVALIVEDHPEVGELDARIATALRPLGLPDVRIRHLVVDDEERSAIVARLHSDGRVPFTDPGSRTRVLLISSGKGGVGKSSVTVNLSIALARRGHRVAIVDADVWGFSIPAMLGIDHPPTLIDQTMIVPPVAHGVACASIGFFVREDQPVVWRGPMLHKALEQFLTDFYWGEPDYLVVDMPPGTGDISISLAGFLPVAEAYVGTTPQAAAQRVAQRAGLMFQSDNIRIPVRGVIENMSWFTGDDGKRYELFGAGGGDELASRLDVPMIGQIPLVEAVRQGGDTGRPIVASEPKSEAALAFADIAEWIDEHRPTRRRNSALKVG
jgi:ATP-binding protein involved in chromosome partitioning